MRLLASILASVVAGNLGEDIFFVLKRWIQFQRFQQVLL